ncbi:MAG: hypothetical protein KGO49_07015 [Gammaproteobacteria bacterium]|nr:hypothetical protein [Gammaproteobacteria bacterium]
MDELQLEKTIKLACKIILDQTLPRCWKIRIVKQGQSALERELLPVHFKSLKGAVKFVSQYRNDWQVNELSDSYTMSASDARSIVADAQP